VTAETIDPAHEAVADADLLSRIAAGDGFAFGRLAERLGPMLRRVVFRLGLSETEVEDSLQETLVRIWQAAAGFKNQSSVSTWACRIAINQGLAAIRSRPRSAIHEPVDVANPERSLEQSWRAEFVRRAVISLPSGLRAVVVLREYEDLSYRTIAEILDIPAGTVMSRLHAARKRLRAELGPLLDESE
jgi:RNA polymerase sigma-70 factor (ECF subfamily)